MHKMEKECKNLAAAMSGYLLEVFCGTYALVTSSAAMQQ